MNKIIMKDNIIDSNFSINIKDNKLFLDNIDTIIIYENSSINIDFSITGNVKIFEYYKNSSCNNKYNIGQYSNLVLNRFNYDCSINTDINLNYVGSKLDYKYSCINFKDNNYLININHNNKDTISDVVNNGLNMTDNRLDFIINSKISKNSTNTICNQDSKIILIGDNNSSIKPNMLVDNDDIIANHSAYLGHFKEEDLFYLESRGITKSEGTKILAKAFLVGIMDIDFLCRNMILQDLNESWGEIYES